jgi:hypothetical protein
MNTQHDKRKSSIKGNVDMWYIKEETSNKWTHVKVVNKRVFPVDPLTFPNGTGIVAITCNNLDNNNYGCKGHSVMVFCDGEWSLVLIWKLQRNLLIGFVVELCSSTELSLTEKNLDLSITETVVKFVSVYGLYDDRIKDPAFLNPIDGKLNIGKRPTSFPVPIPVSQ